jgi:hypothetical protein
MAVFKIQTGLRIDEPTYEKLRTIAFRENRSINNLIEYIVKRYIDEFEKEKGKIVPLTDE